MQGEFKRILLRAAAILAAAVAEVARNWQPLLVALILPVLGSSVVMQLQFLVAQSRGATLALLVPILFFYVLFAMSCHRIILLGADSLPNRFGVYWTLRELKFVGWVVLIGLLTAGLWVPISFVYLLAPIPSTVTTVVWYFTWFLVIWFEGRLSMVLPATAVDARPTLRASWDMTRGHGLSIALALFIPALVASLLETLAWRAFGEDASQALAVVADVFLFPLIAVGVGVLSVSYRFLSDSDRVDSRRD